MKCERIYKGNREFAGNRKWQGLEEVVHMQEDRLTKYI